MAQGAIITHPSGVVIADQVILRPTTGISRPGGQFIIGPAQNFLFGNHKLMLHMPEATASKVHVDQFVVGCCKRWLRKNAGGNAGSAENAQTNPLQCFSSIGRWYIHRWAINVERRHSDEEIKRSECVYCKRYHCCSLVV